MKRKSFPAATLAGVLSAFVFGGGPFEGATGEIVCVGSQNSNISHDVVRRHLPA